MKDIFWVIELTIKEGRMSDLRALMAEMKEATYANEPDCINYEWFISADETKCTIYERYTNSDAVMTHLGNFGTHFADRFMDVLEIDKFIAYGNPSEMVREALGSLGVVFMNPFGGFSR